MHASCTADPQDAVPEEPPAIGANPMPLSATSILTRSSGAPSASAAIWASTVRAPVPMSVALTRTRNPPSGTARAEATHGETSTG